MKRLLSITTLAAVLLVAAAVTSQATFSIVAVDTASGIIGGAGASCIDNAQIIDDIIESVGAVHTQAYYLEQNQDAAHLLLAQGQTPDSIIAWLVANDAGGRPQLRQYGIVTLAGPAASASYTGSSNSYWAGQLNGSGYAIQGNILLGPEIIAGMETAFLGTDGPLEQKLMAALEAAKIPGADSRCLAAGKSSISAFIKVVRPGDGPTPFLYEVVPNTAPADDPIDLLRVQFDNWQLAQAAHPDSSLVTVAPLILEADGSKTATVTITPKNYAGKPPVQIDSVTLVHSGSGSVSGIVANPDGTFTATVTAPTTPGYDTITVSVSAYYGIVNELNTQPALRYYQCGDASGDDDGPNVSDLTFVVAYLFSGGPMPPVIAAANVDGIFGPGGPVDVSDLTYFVAFLFGGGPGPICE